MWRPLDRQAGAVHAIARGNLPAAAIPAYQDLCALLLIWVLGLAALGLGRLVGGLPSPFEALTGLPCPLCNASTAIRQLLAGELTAALHLHATATLTALLSVLAIPALMLRLRLALRAETRIYASTYAVIRRCFWSSIVVMLLLQWCLTLLQGGMHHV